MGNLDQGEILKRLSEEFVEETKERLEKLWRLFEADRSGQHVDGALHEFLRELHTMKGHGSVFGFQSVTVAAHHIEDLLSSLIGEPNWTLPEVKDLLLLIDDIIESGADMPLKELQEKLPWSEQDEARDEAPITIVWVCSARVIRHKVRRDLEVFGFRVISMHDAFEAMRYIANVMPDVVITSATLDGLPGTDLVRAVDAMNTTKHIPSIVVTSFDQSHPDIMALPSYVPVVRLGQNMVDEIVGALTGLELKRVDPDRPVRALDS